MNLMEGSELKYLDVLLLAFIPAALSLVSVLANHDMEMDPKTRPYKVFTELVPLILVLMVIAILTCPFNILYRSSRLFFLTCLFHCICAPLYKAEWMPEVLRNEPSNEKDPKLRPTFVEIMAALKPLQKPIISSHMARSGVESKRIVEDVVG